MVGEMQQSSPQQGKPRFGARLQLGVTSSAVTASLGSQHSAPRELCHNCHPCAQQWGGEQKSPNPEDNDRKPGRDTPAQLGLQRSCWGCS